MDKIKSVEAIEGLNGRGVPTVEVRLTTGKGIVTLASAPMGTSKGTYEAFELFDGDPQWYRGRGVQKAAEHVNTVINETLIGMDVTDQRAIDRALCEADGTLNKRVLGGNAILPVSVAACKAGAASVGLPIYRYLGGETVTRVPDIISTMISGGAYGQSGLEFEDYIAVQNRGERSFAFAAHTMAAIRHNLEKKLVDRFGVVADDGGAFSPPLGSTREAFDLMLQAAEECGVKDVISLGLDVAATDPYDSEANVYRMGSTVFEKEALKQFYLGLAADYPLTYLEDPFEENDYDGFAQMTAALPGLRIVGDDLFASHPVRLKEGIARKAGNTILLKINQIGSVSEAIQTAMIAKKNGIGITVSLRSKDTNDDFVADLATGIGAEQLKLGSPVRGERIAKYNRLLWIDRELNK